MFKKMFRRLRGFIRMKREQRELRNRMSTKTWYELNAIIDDLYLVYKSLADKTEECIDMMYNAPDNELSKEEIRDGIVPEYSYYYGYLNAMSNKVFMLWSELDDIVNGI